MVLLPLINLSGKVTVIFTEALELPLTKNSAACGDVASIVVVTPEIKSPNSRSFTLVMLKEDVIENDPDAVADAVSCAMLKLQRNTTSMDIRIKCFITMLM